MHSGSASFDGRQSLRAVRFEAEPRNEIDTRDIQVLSFRSFRVNTP